MGFWGNLGKVFKAAAPVVGAIAAPMTGGASLALTGLSAGLGGVGSVLDGAGQVGQVAGNAAQGAASQRVLENQARNQYNTNQINAYKTQNDIAVNNPASFAKQAYTADVMANIKNPTASAGGSGRQVTNVFGAATPAQKQAMAELQRQAMLNLLQSPDKNPVPNAPQLAKYQEAGMGEKLLGASGLFGSLASAASPIVNAFMGKNTTETTTTPQPKPLELNPYDEEWLSKGLSQGLRNNVGNG